MNPVGFYGTFTNAPFVDAAFFNSDLFVSNFIDCGSEGNVSPVGLNFISCFRLWLYLLSARFLREFVLGIVVRKELGWVDCWGP